MPATFLRVLHRAEARGHLLSPAWSMWSESRTRRCSTNSNGRSVSNGRNSTAEGMHDHSLLRPPPVPVPGGILPGTPGFLGHCVDPFFTRDPLRTSIAAGCRSDAPLRTAAIDGALSSLVVLSLCAPSYLWLEPDAAVERVGTACLAAAILGAAICAAGAARGRGRSIRSARYLRNCESLAYPDMPVLMLAGVFHPRLVVSCGVRDALTAEQLDVALRHEWAHGTARDNLKRLLLRLAPDMFPGWRGFDALERNWSRLAERAADDRAVRFARTSLCVGLGAGAGSADGGGLGHTAARDFPARRNRRCCGARRTTARRQPGQGSPRGLPAPAIALAFCGAALCSTLPRSMRSTGCSNG